MRTVRVIDDVKNKHHTQHIVCIIYLIIISSTHCLLLSFRSLLFVSFLVPRSVSVCL